MSDGHIDTRPTQASENTKTAGVQLVLDDLFWMRKELEDLREAIFDHTVLIARLAQKIEEWVGVAEE